MRSPVLFVAALALLSGPVLAQTSPEPAQPAPRPSHRKAPHPAHAQHRAHRGTNPVDVGPYTPEASRAYQGGGMILQGAPGDPAPTR